jgi:hypothetical protein
MSGHIRLRSPGSCDRLSGWQDPALIEEELIRRANQNGNR